MKEAFLYEKLDNNTVKCTACKQYCKISEGSTGICGVRLNKDGKLYLLVYGKASAVNVDPIEKKPLFHFLPGTGIFSIGTVGCNFSCSFCQNWNISQVTKHLKEEIKEKQLLIGKITDFGQELQPEDIVNYIVGHNIKSIAFTYNEPVIFFEYIFDTVLLAKKHGIKTVFVSNGYESDEALNKINSMLDAINIDLKSFSDAFYLKTCKAKLENVLETIKSCHKKGIWIEITTLVIPGENDSNEELKSIAEFIASVSKSVPWHVTAFHPDYKMTDKTHTPTETLNKAYDIGKGAGLKYVYVGNVVDTKRSSTYCPSCNEVVIERVGYDIKPMFKGDKCRNCGEKIDGIFS